MLHYHGTPITPETAGIKALTARHGLVSWVQQQHLELVAGVCQSFILDNGAFSAWRQGKAVDWDDYYEWTAEWLRHPGCDWAIIPDVIEGSEQENDELVDDWPHGGHAGVPVWHMNESFDRFARLCEEWPRVAIGSSGEFDVRKPSVCVERATKAILHTSSDGRPRSKLHGLRMLNPKIASKLPLTSADSSTVARNCGLDVRWKGVYAPTTRESRAVLLAERLESTQTPDRVLPL